MNDSSKLEITPIPKVSVGEQVFNQLKQLILNNKWSPGEKIPSENELADMFHVSRITVRQALQKLNALGLIDTKLGEGSFVKRLDGSENMNALIPSLYLGGNITADVLEFRRIIDTDCAKLAALRATEKDIEDLKDIFEKMEQCKSSLNLRGFAHADLDFHFKIAETTKNSLIIKTNMILRDVLEDAMLTIIDKMGFEKGLYYHKELLIAIENHDEETALFLMQSHLQENSRYLK